MAFHLKSTRVWTVVSLFALAAPVLAQKPGINTPGAKTKANEAQVCAADFMASVKPASSWQKTEALKRYGMRADNFTGELDLLIPASLGGSNDPDNLWPQPANKEWGPEAKDKLEDVLHTMVCDKKISLKEAQDAIRKDWIKAYEKYVTAAQ